MNPGRRRLLRGAGAAALAGLVVPIVAPLQGCTLPVIPKRPPARLADAMGWLQHIDGHTTLLLPRVEMGQGIDTALKQIACEELGVPWHAVTVRLPHTGEIPRVRATVGSDSVKDYALPLAQACATLREALAAGQRQGRLAPQPRPREALRAFQRRAAGTGPAHPIGRAAPLPDGLALVTGAPLFVADTRLPGMVHGRVLRAPVAPSLASRLEAADEAAARAVPGFVALVRDPLLQMDGSMGLGVLARTPDALDRIAAALAPRWSVAGQFEATDLASALDLDAANRLRPRPRYRVLDEGRDDADPAGPWDVDLRLDIPLAAHAPMEPRAAVAVFDAPDRLRLWVGSQDVFYQGDVVARRLGLPAAQVTVQACRVGGAFGGKTTCTVELEAAVLARAAGAPVKVQWTRAQEFALGFHRPPSRHRLRIRLREGRLQHWSHRFASSHILFTNAAVPAWMQRATDLIGDGGVARGAEPPYRAPVRQVGYDLRRLPVYTGPWRGLGAGPNVTAIECAIDEAARRAGADPVAFRLAHLDDPRLTRVLRRAAAMAEALPPVDATRARGVACGIYKAMSYAAVVAEVQVDRATGAVRVTAMWCAHDCGQVIHPGHVRAQCEGNLVWGLGMALVESLPVAGSGVAAADFAASPIPRLRQIPPMQVELIDEGDPPTGAGETAIVAAAAAVLNAVRAATGVRVQALPVDAAALRAAWRRGAPTA